MTIEGPVSQRSMTDEEVSKFAKDLYADKIFTDCHLNSPDQLPSVFMPLALLTKEEVEKLGWDKNPPGVVYEYMNAAGGITANGMPTFMSFRYLSQADFQRVGVKYEEIKASMEKL